VMALSLGGGTAAYVHAVQGQEEIARLKLLEEQSSREQAERQMHEVQAKQLKIDELLRDLADSPKKETVLALQRQIREAETQSSLETKEKPAPVLASTGRPLASMPMATATAAAPATAAAAAPPAVSAPPAIPVIKQQTNWE
jgi:hypothetical protein